MSLTIDACMRPTVDALCQSGGSMDTNVEMTNDIYDEEIEGQETNLLANSIDHACEHVQRLQLPISLPEVQ